MPIHGLDGDMRVVEIRADSEVTVESDRDVFTIEYTDPGTPFGRSKPHIRVVMTADTFLKTLSKAHVGFLMKTITGSPNT